MIMEGKFMKSILMHTGRIMLALYFLAPGIGKFTAWDANAALMEAHNMVMVPFLLAIAAVAQVAVQEKIPWLIIRVISDGADNAAEKNFINFLEKYKKCSWDLINALLKRYLDAPWDKED